MGALCATRCFPPQWEEAYRNRLLKGKFPGCVLHIQLPTELVDVNVHPAKTVVKFVNEKTVFDAVYYTIKDVLTAGEKPAEKPRQPVRQESFYQTMTVQQYREQAAQSREKGPLGSYTGRPVLPHPDEKLAVRDASPVQPAARASAPTLSGETDAVRAAPAARICPVRTAGPGDGSERAACGRGRFRACAIWAGDRQRRRPLGFP